MAYNPFSFGFDHMIGPVYGVEGKDLGAELVFSGDSLLVPVGNRVNILDLRGNKVRTLACENRAPIHHMALSPNGRVLVTVDERGGSLIVAMPRGVEVGRFSFKGPVTALKFSPDSKWLLVAIGRLVEVYRTPLVDRKQFSSFVKFRSIYGAFDDVISVNWSSDSQFVIMGSRDMSVRIHSLKRMLGFRRGLLGGHRDFVVAASFGSNDNTHAYTVSRDGLLCKWEWTHEPEFLDIALERMDEEDESYGDEASLSDSSDSDDDDDSSEMDEQSLQNLAYGRWKLKEKFFFNTAGSSGGPRSVLTSARFHSRGLVVAGFSDGLFGVYALDTMECVHTLTVGDGESSIKAIGINDSGDWLAFGSSTGGQLLVWEWQSETYIYKQQAHTMGIRHIAYSPDGRLMATGGQDGKVKLWETSSGTCFVTFGEHQGPITDVLFSGKGTAVFSSSMDGTIRGFDLTRYRNFRTMSAPNPVQFACLAMDPSGDIVCAGTLDDFTVYVFRVQTGELLEVLGGHEAPVSRVLFSPTDPILASCAWDGTVRLHDLYARGQGAGSRELLRHGESGRDVVCAAYRQDGLELVVGLLDGSLHFWDPKEVQETGIIDGRLDIWAGRGAMDVRQAGRQSSHFESVAYGSGGESVLAVANGSKWVLMYGVRSKTLLKRFCLTQNVAIEGVLEMQNSKLLTDFGPVAEVAPTNASFSERQRALPGAMAPTSRDICVSPSGDEWSALSPEGVHVFRRDHGLVLDAPGLTMGDTPESVRVALLDGDLTRALSVAMGLESSVVPNVLLCIPLEHISLVASALPVGLVGRLLSVVADQINSDRPQLELCLHWVRWIMGSHATVMKQEFSRFREPVLAVQRAMARKTRSLALTTELNLSMMSYLMQAPIAEEEEDADGEIDLMEIEATERVPLFIEPEPVEDPEPEPKRKKNKKRK